MRQVPAHKSTDPTPLAINYPYCTPRPRPLKQGSITGRSAQGPRSSIPQVPNAQASAAKGLPSKGRKPPALPPSFPPLPARSPWLPDTAPQSPSEPLCRGRRNGKPPPSYTGPGRPSFGAWAEARPPSRRLANYPLPPAEPPLLPATGSPLSTPDSKSQTAALPPAAPVQLLPLPLKACPFCCLSHFLSVFKMPKVPPFLALP